MTSSSSGSAAWVRPPAGSLRGADSGCSGLERFDIPHAHGSSHGVTRIIRLAYYESPDYVPLLRRAFELWGEASAAAGEPLLVTTGSFDAGPRDSDVFNGSLESCRVHGLAHEVLTGAEVNARHPGYRLPDDFAAVFQPDGGFVLSERAIVAHATMAMAAGAEIHGREAVLEWSPIAGGGVRVTTTRGEYEAARLVLSPGAWIGDLVPALKQIAIPERQVLGWFQPADPARFMPSAFPVLNLLVEEGRYYLLPIHGVPGLKIGLYHHLGEHGPAETLSREITPRTRRYCGAASADIFPTRTARSCRCTAACSPTRRTSTSSSTPCPASLKSSSPRPARATATNSQASSGRSSPTSRFPAAAGSTSRCSVWIVSRRHHDGLDKLCARPHHPIDIPTPAAGSRRSRPPCPTTETGSRC